MSGDGGKIEGTSGVETRGRRAASIHYFSNSTQFKMVYFVDETVKCLKPLRNTCSYSVPSSELNEKTVPVLMPVF